MVSVLEPDTIDCPPRTPSLAPDASRRSLAALTYPFGRVHFSPNGAAKIGSVVDQEPPDSEPRPETPEQHDHRLAQREHSEWREDLGRWRQEFLEAVLTFACRMNPDLDIRSYQDALDSHESALTIAIDIHEQAVQRHERALGLEARGAHGASEDFEELHAELDSRHAQTRSRHATLAERHATIVDILRGDDQS
jgi:hypothetical protein